MKMLENNNKKNIKTLSDSCLKANKGRNTIAIFAITLTAILFMSLTTAFEGSSINIRNQLLRQSGTKFMVSIKNLTKADRFLPGIYKGRSRTVCFKRIKSRIKLYDCHSRLGR